MSGGHKVMNGVPTTRVEAAVPEAREKQALAAQPWQERGLLSQVSLKLCGTCDRGGAHLQEGQGAAEKVPGGGQLVI